MPDSSTAATVMAALHPPGTNVDVSTLELPAAATTIVHQAVISLTALQIGLVSGLPRAPRLILSTSKLCSLAYDRALSTE